jgi:hypothetical protein
VSVHPGGGQILVVDSHPAPNVSPDGKGCLRERGQTWDSSFGFEAHSVTLHEYQGSGNQLREAVDNAPAVSSFVDSGANAYWDPVQQREAAGLRPADRPAERVLGRRDRSGQDPVRHDR